MALNEWDITEILSKYIQKNDVCVDVGANEGYYTKFLTKELDGTGKVYSIELFPETFRTLVSELGDQPNLEIINCAASDSDGFVKYYRGRDSSTNNIIGHDMDYNKNEEAGEIRSMKLDTILQSEPRIKFIKIDVEGSENMVLRGMGETLKKTDIIFLECHLDEHWKETANILLVENDFEIFRLEDMKPLSIEDPRAYNVLCKKKKQTA